MPLDPKEIPESPALYSPFGTNSGDSGPEQKRRPSVPFIHPSITANRVERAISRHGSPRFSCSIFIRPSPGDASSVLPSFSSVWNHCIERQDQHKYRHRHRMMTEPSSTPSSGSLKARLDNIPVSDSTDVENNTPPPGSIKNEGQPSGPGTGEETERRRTVTGVRWILVCVAIFSANVLYGLDTTIAADIQAFVSETFDNVTQLGWLGVGFTLGSTVAILPLGKAFGTFDAKWVFLSCLTMFAAASALCGAAPSMNAIIVGRVWAGAGGAGMYLGYGVSIAMKR